MVAHAPNPSTWEAGAERSQTESLALPTNTHLYQGEKINVNLRKTAKVTVLKIS